MNIMEKPDYSTPAKKRRYVEAECRQVEAAAQKADPDIETYLSGFYGARRQKAILNYLDRAEADFEGFGLRSTVESFTRRELLPTGNYNRLDADCDIVIGASLWIIEKLRTGGKLNEAYNILPDVSGDIDAYCLPVDFFHPCYSNDLIQSVAQVLFRRYPSARMGKCIITEENALGKEAGETYRNLIALLPEEEVRNACDVFKEKIWEIEERFMKGKSCYDKEIDLIARRLASTQSAILAPLSNPTAFGSGRAGVGNPGGFSGFYDDGRDSETELFLQFEELRDRIQKYSVDFDRYLQMDRKRIRKESERREIAVALSGFEVRDPYELLFALLYLIDHGDDAPWLLSSGSSLILFALRMLPWFEEYEEWDIDKWEESFGGLSFDRNGWLEKEAVPEQPDYYHQKHGDKNLAQIIYNLCRGVVPVGLHPFEDDRIRLVEEGMEEHLARKITDTASLMFLTAFQASQSVYSSFPELDEEDEEYEQDDALPSMTGGGEFGSDGGEAKYDGAKEVPIKPGGYWGHVAKTQGLQVEEVPEASRNVEVAAGSALPDAAEQNVELTEELRSLRKQLKAVRKALAGVRKESKEEKLKYEHELNALRMEHRELADLRELVFNQEAEERRRLEQVEKQYKFPYRTIKRTVIFGGHENFLKSIKPMLPTVRFVDADYKTFSPEIIRNADVVWIQNNCISHSQYWNIVKICKTAGVQMRYFAYVSAEKCAEQLVKEDRK